MKSFPKSYKNISQSQLVAFYLLWIKFCLIRLTGWLAQGEPALWKLVFGLSGTVRQVIRIVNWLFMHTHATTSQTMASFSDPLEGLFADTGSVGER